MLYSGIKEGCNNSKCIVASLFRANFEFFAISLDIQVLAVYNIYVYLYSLPVRPFSRGKV